MFKLSAERLQKLYDYETLDKILDKCSTSLESPVKKTPILHQGDIDFLTFTSLKQEAFLAVDTETGGLSPIDHKLHLVQIATLDGSVHIVQNPGPHSELLRQLLLSGSSVKICHWMKFDIAFLMKGLEDPLRVEDTWSRGFVAAAHAATNANSINVFNTFVCTKVMTKLLKPGMNASLKNTVKLFLNKDLDKQVEHGNWDAETLSERQVEYAANDVLVLIPLLVAQLQDFVKNKERVKDYMDQVSRQVQKALALDALLQMHGFTDLLEHGYDKRKCKNPLLRQPEVPSELDDSWNDGNTERPKASGSTS